MAEQEKSSQNKRIVDVTTLEGSRALAEVLESLKGTPLDTPTKDFHELIDLRDKLFKE